MVLRVGGGVEGTDELPPDLAEMTTELHEWAAVSAALGCTRGAARTIVRRRAEQLAAGYATQWGVPVAVVDGSEVREFCPDEPTPWATGLVVAAFALVVVVVALVALSTGLAAINPLLAVAANLVVVGGLAPSAWLCRTLPVWRWVALGASVGVGLAWSWLLLSAVVS